MSARIQRRGRPVKGPGRVNHWMGIGLTQELLDGIEQMIALRQDLPATKSGVIRYLIEQGLKRELPSALSMVNRS
jgi:hypothetical protein